MDKTETYFYPLWLEAVKLGNTLLGFHDWIAEQYKI